MAGMLGQRSTSRNGTHDRRHARQALYRSGMAQPGSLDFVGRLLGWRHRVTNLVLQKAMPSKAGKAGCVYGLS